MIIVKLELWPKGDESKKMDLGHAKIANDGMGTPELGNYSVALYKWRTNKLWKSGRVTGFPRQKLGPWDLLYRCLKEIVGDRNVEK